MTITKAQLRVFGPMVVLALVVGWFAWTGIQSRNDATRDRHAIALFIQSDAKLRRQDAQDFRETSAYWRGLAVHAPSCKSACVSQKFAAFLAGAAGLRSREAARSEHAADYWDQLVQRLGMTIGGPARQAR